MAVHASAHLEQFFFGRGHVADKVWATDNDDRTTAVGQHMKLVAECSVCGEAYDPSDLIQVLALIAQYLAGGEGREVSQDFLLRPLMLRGAQTSKRSSNNDARLRDGVGQAVVT